MTQEPAKFRLNKTDSKLLGVCAGIADYLGIDPLIVRLVFAIGTVVGFGSFIVIYLLIALLAN
ncbi:PspC domain-containing protein [Altericroceibacterium spongiae]|uniref:PspC domain-containing protein n=1 Tax=Altericroceibacterium spongiae TaxID=2320269 RepID=A0A420EQM7_9SPHN|nr:PspC domain-containing protein [Altericroceibacterium spongiae]RKF22971.1 PspC domain-containing protein [Altericroceibacterium spongiae]